MIRLCMAILLAAATALMLPLPAQAAKVSPMILELEPTGQDSIARVTLTNTSNRDIPYEVLMMRGIISVDGELEMVPADDLFLVFPAHSIVESNSQQVFRIQYVGDPGLAQSETFYMSIRQVPVELDPNTTQVQVVVNYNVLLNVVPEGTSPDPTVSEIELASQDDQTGLRLLVGNDGTRHFMAGMAKWRVTGTTVGGEAYEADYDGGQLTEYLGVGVVGPGRSRRFFIPTDGELVPDTVQIEITP